MSEQTTPTPTEAYFAYTEAAAASAEARRVFDDTFRAQFEAQIDVYNRIVGVVTRKLHGREGEIDRPWMPSTMRISLHQIERDPRPIRRTADGRLVLHLGVHGPLSNSVIDEVPLDVLGGSDRDMSADVRRRFRARLSMILEADEAHFRKGLNSAQASADRASEELAKMRRLHSVAERRLANWRAKAADPGEH